MPPGRRLRRASLLLVAMLGIAAVGATQSVRLARLLEPEPKPVPVPVAAETGPRGSSVARDRPRVRRRRPVAHAGATTVAATSAEPTPEAGASTGAAPPAASGAAGRAYMVGVTGDISILDDGATLRAALAEGPGGGPAEAVEGGSPPELSVADYVESSGTRVRGAVELVGERRPLLEDGVPVAITGRVVEKSTGTPVPDADVFLTSTFYVRSLRYDHHLREVGRARTDADGEFRVARLNADPAHFGAGGLVYVSVRSESHAPMQPVPLVQVSPGYANRLDDIALEPEAFALAGRVLDWAESGPVVGARVFATGAIDPVAYPKDQRDALFLGAPEAVTDEDGAFVLRGLGTGEQVVSVHAGDDCIGRERVRVPDAARVEIRTLPIHGRIEGRVLDERGAPVPLVFVQGGQNSTHSFADGRFVLENFVGDDIDVWFAHADHRALLLRKLPDGSRDVEVRLESRWPELRLAVRHRDTGAPITTLAVEFEFADAKRAPVPASPWYLDEDGVHAVRVRAGVVRLRVTAAGLVPATVEMHGRADGDVVPLLLSPVE